MLPPPASPPPDDVGLLDVDERVEPTDVVGQAPGGDRDPPPPPAGTFRKIGAGMGALGLLVALTYLVPALEFARPWDPARDPVLFWNIVGREWMGEGDRVERAAERLERLERLAAAAGRDEPPGPIEDQPILDPSPADRGPPPYQPHPDDELEIPRSLELPSPTALDPFYARLTRTDARYAGAITRVSHWGDSVIANDNVSSALRFAMQRRFGDAGHGFHLVARPNANYRHRGVRFSGGDGWEHCYIINRCRGDGRYGLGGTVASSHGGAESRFRTEDKLPFGRKASRLELWYRATPRSGRLRVKIDKLPPITVDTAAESPRDAWHTIPLDDGAHDIQLRAGNSGGVRLYGVVLERDVPGVVWDGMEQLGAFADRMLYFDPEHLRAQIDHRDPGLLVFSFGGNDLLLAEAKLPRYERDFGEVLRRFRGANEPIACLVMAPVDHGQRSGARIVSRPMVAKIVEIQRRVARAEGCAFFDTVAAMGGDGSAGRWRRSTPPLLSGDLAHLTVAGQQAVGQMLYLALMEGYRDYRRRTG